MNEEYLKDELLALAYRQDIDVLDIDTSDEYAPDIAFPFIKKIMMNPNFSTSYKYCFRLAHEIAHILYGDTSSLPYYRFSPLFMKVEENSANTHAVEMIANIVYRDVPLEQRNWLDFMDSLGLQSHFEELVKEVIYK
ncbi:ImmA/IrrE family metallo-endopeptidase [Weissella confusa]|uniref:ImmA/IrrE family metallo-endopeptidase n=1 Tax=Weissella confusa TaxID=1583 RepID=UPI0018F1FCCC|nr:ImmA/IrrE family metallo-endopeptidase [Weissella confusa]MBJ7615344.1 ImmA/IrrE family metallo-endopeptidase [Weissella confusa]